MPTKTTTRLILAALAVTMAIATLSTSAGADTVPTSNPPEVLTGARRDLRIAELTLARILGELKTLQALSGVDPEVLADYQAYSEAVRRMVETQRKFVRAIESVAANRTAESFPSEPASSGGTQFDPPLPSNEDRLDRLEREFEESLEEFDAFLLQAQYEAQRWLEKTEDASSEEMTDLAEAAAAAVERLREKGIDVDTKSPSSQGEGAGQRSSEEGDAEETDDGAGGTSHADAGTSEGRAGAGQGSSGTSSGGSGSGQDGLESQTGDAGDFDGGADQNGQGASGGQQTEGSPGDSEGGDPVGEGAQDAGEASGGSAGSESDAAPEGHGSPGEGESATPSEPDRPPADDDDIVARQLREAAENETDPELKRKLWEEYDRYKGKS